MIKPAIKKYSQYSFAASAYTGSGTSAVPAVLQLAILFTVFLVSLCLGGANSAILPPSTRKTPWLPESLFVLLGPSRDTAGCGGVTGDDPRCGWGWSATLAAGPQAK